MNGVLAPVVIFIRYNSVYDPPGLSVAVLGILIVYAIHFPSGLMADWDRVLVPNTSVGETGSAAWMPAEKTDKNIETVNRTNSERKGFLFMFFLHKDFTYDVR